MNFSDLHRITGAIFVLDDIAGGSALLEIPQCYVTSLELNPNLTDVTTFGDPIPVFVRAAPAAYLSLEMAVTDSYQFHRGRRLPAHINPSGVWLPNTTIEIAGTPLHELRQ